MLDVRVAGVAALLIAKCYKLGERLREANQRRLVNKDAGDVLRLMLTAEVGPVSERLRILLADPRSEATTRQGLKYLEQLFGDAERRGVVMAITALAPAIDATQIRTLAPAYATALQRAAIN